MVVSLLWSPGLTSVFSAILIMLESCWSRFVPRFFFRPITKPSGTVPSAPNTICLSATVTIFSDLWQGLSDCRFFPFLCFSHCSPLERQNPLFSKFSYYYSHSFSSFSQQRLLIVSHWSLSDSKSPQDPRTLLSIPADLNNALV